MRRVAGTLGGHSQLRSSGASPLASVPTAFRTHQYTARLRKYSSTTQPQRRTRRSKLVIVLATGLVAGSAAAYWARKSRLERNASITAKDFHQSQQPRLDDALPRSLEDLRHKSCIFYRYTTCPFCGKVKAFLDYYGVPYVAVEVEPMFKSQITDHGYTKVPQLQLGADGPILVDSDEIVDILGDIVGADTKGQEVGTWRGWARERLVRFLVININRTLKEAFEGYSYIDQFDTIPTVNKYFLKFVGAPVMYMVARYVTKPKLLKLNEELKETSERTGKGIQPFDPKENERTALHREVRVWTEQGLNSKRFHGGDAEPDIADLDVYGVLQSIRGHAIYIDLCRTNPKLNEWLETMDQRVRARSAQQIVRT